MHTVHGRIVSAMRKVRSGISFDPKVARELNRSKDSLGDLTRSEVVNAILADFFRQGNTPEKVWAVVLRRRTRSEGR